MFKLSGQKVRTKNGLVPIENLCGWGVWRNGLEFDEQATQELLRKNFDIFGVDSKTLDIIDAQKTQIKGFNLYRQLNVIGASPIKGGERVMLWEVARKVLGKDTPHYPQEVGSCVGFGAKNAIEHIQLFPVANGISEFKTIFAPYLYGTGRVFIGKSQLGPNDDGSLGGWQAEAVLKYGAIPTDSPGCPPYSGNIDRKWGYKPGPPQQFIDIGMKRLVKSAALVRSWEDVIKGIVNGYAITIASDVGFDMTPRSDGFHHHSTKWPHQMCATPYMLTSYIKPQFIKDVKIGDRVFGHDGKNHTVTETFERRYVGKLISIKTSGNLPLELTPNHPIMILRNGIASWLNAEDIRKDDLVVCPIPNLYFDKPIIPEWLETIKNKKLKPLEVNDELAWLFGLYIADGDSTKNHKIKIKLALHEEEEAIRAGNAIELLGLKPFIKYKNNHISIVAYSSTLANSFNEWFGKQTNKHIPEWLFTWNIREVLNGIYAGDGNVPTGRPEGRRIVNTSRILIDQIRTILLYLGEKPSVGQHLYNNHRWNTRYHIEWYPIQTKIHTNYIDKDKNEYIMKVRSIEEKDYDGYVYNFEVEDCHSYIAEGIVVHNCIVGVDNDHSTPYACIQNQWGDVHGTIKDFTTGETWPIGTLRVLRKDIETILRANESFAYSQFEGFPSQELPRNFFNIF